MFLLNFHSGIVKVYAVFYANRRINMRVRTHIFELQCAGAKFDIHGEKNK